MDVYEMYGIKKYHAPIVRKLIPVTIEDLNEIYKMRIQMLYMEYCQEYDEEEFDDIMWRLGISGKKLEENIVKYLVKGNIDLQFFQEIGKINLGGYRSMFVLIK